MSNYQVSQTEFLENVKNHKMHIIKDEGVYRHVRFKQDNTGNRYFDLITWPGHLCYTGDMGTYVFSRINDMFEFFAVDNKKYPINPSYWAEKVLADNKHDGVEEFSVEKFKQCVWDDVEREIEDLRESDEDYADEYEEQLREAIEDEIMYYLDDKNASLCYNTVYEFTFTHDKREFQFVDFWEHDFNVYTYRYIWACYAISWGIEQYSTMKQGETVEQD